MVKYCLVCDFDAVASMVHSAEKVFIGEFGSETNHCFLVEKDFFHTCMAVVEEIITSLFTAECLDYFVSLKDSRYHYYFGGKESE